MSHLDQIEALLAETTGWLEWISPKATTEIAVVFADGSVYLPTGGTEEEFAFANAQGKVRRLVRAEDVAPLAKFAREVGELRESLRRFQAYRVDVNRDSILRTLDAAFERLEQP